MYANGVKIVLLWKSHFASESICPIIATSSSHVSKISVPESPVPLIYIAWLNSYLQKASIEETIRDNIAGFSNNEFGVHLSSGPTYPKIPLLVCEFRPKNREFLSLPQLVPCGSDSQARAIVHDYALPLGLPESSLKLLRRACIDHIKSIVEGPRNPGEWKYGDTSKVSWMVFEATDRYRRATQVPGKVS
jgi:hypothetical protein